MVKTVIIAIQTDAPVDLGNIDKAIHEAHHTRIEVVNEAVSLERSDMGVSLAYSGDKAAKLPVPAPKKPRGRPYKFPPHVTEDMAELLISNRRLLRVVKRHPEARFEIAINASGNRYLRLNIKETLEAIGLTERELMSKERIWPRKSLQMRLRSAIHVHETQERKRQAQHSAA